MLVLEELRASFVQATAGGDHGSVALGALVIARIGHPELSPEPALAALDALAAAVRPRMQPSDAPEQRAAVLAHYLFEECGYRGNSDDYYDPRNSFLNDVLRSARMTTVVGRSSPCLISGFDLRAVSKLAWASVAM